MKRRNFIDYSYFNKFLLNACGVLPIKSPNNFISLFLIFVTIASSCFIFVPGYYSLIFHWNSITPSDKFDIMIDSNAFIVCTIKVILLFPKRQKHISLMDSCAKLWRYIETDEDLAIVEEYVKLGLHLTYIFAGNCLLASTFFLSTPLFAKLGVDANGTVVTSKKLPFSAGIFPKKAEQFWIWHALQVPSNWDSALAIVAIDTALLFYVLQACAHMRLCQKYFERITDAVTLGHILTPNDHSDTLLEQVTKGVTYHTEILQYSKDVEEMFDSVILAQVLESLIVMCGFCFGILSAGEKERPKFVTSALSVVVELLLLCWPPDTLQDEGLKMASAAYNLPWYDWTKKEGSLVSMIIAKSQRPVVITAKKLTIISLETFAWVVKTAFSMVTLVRQVLE